MIPNLQSQRSDAARKTSSVPIIAAETCAGVADAAMRRMGFQMWLKRFVRWGLSRNNESLWLAMKNIREELRIHRQSRKSEKRLRQLRAHGGMKVHLGCGTDVRRGWVNIDVDVNRPSKSDSEFDDKTLIFNYDLRRGLPLADGSCDYIYSSHFFEHLEARHALDLVRDCHRALRPGGVFRMALPRQRETFAAYLQGDIEYFGPVDEYLPTRPGLPRMCDFINYHCYQNGEHRFIIDEETALSMLNWAGYRLASVSEYKPNVDPSTELRRAGSFYVEATK